MQELGLGLCGKQVEFCLKSLKSIQVLQQKLCKFNYVGNFLLQNV